MEEESVLGPFITVVSVDGGIQSTNKLTVITPTEINDSSPRLSIVHEDADEESFADEEEEEEEDSRPSSLRGAYVTVLSLGKKQEINNSNQAQKKSVVNIITEQTKSTPHVVAILSKTDRQIPIPKERKSKSIVDIQSIQKSSSVEIKNNNSMKTNSENTINGYNISKQEGVKSERAVNDYVTEQVTVYKLPGERLGFGLRFDGGVTNPTEKVKRLFIQSCAEDSPAARTKASWGNLEEGDEILGIENVPVSCMTRMDCIQSLKDASVVLHLLIRHFYSLSHFSWEDPCEKNNALNNNSSVFLNPNFRTLCREDAVDKNVQPAEPVRPEPKLRHEPSLLLFPSAVSERNSEINLSVSTSKIPIATTGTTAIVPVAPPRKGKPEVLEIPNEPLLPMKIKPPMGFADEDKMSLPPEAKVYTFAVESQEKFYSCHSESLSMCESDDSHSTRSTVVSRLSMMSMNNMTECAKRIEVVGQGSGLEGIEGVTSPSFSTHDDEAEDEIPLAPPLHFQDLTNANSAEDERNRSHISCTPSQMMGSYHGAQIESDGLVPLEFVLMQQLQQQQQQHTEERGLIGNPLPYNNSHLIDMNDDDELALLAEELGLGQDDEEDEAEELRKFLLLEEKLRTIHDKDNGDKQDTFGNASSQRDALAIAEEDEEEEEEQDEKEETEKMTQNKECHIFNDQLSAHNEIQTGTVDNVPLRSEFDERKCNSAQSNEFTSTLNNNPLSEEKREYEGTNGISGPSMLMTTSNTTDSQLRMTTRKGDCNYRDGVLLSRNTTTLCHLDQQKEAVLGNNPVIEPIFETDEQSDGTTEGHDSLQGNPDESNSSNSLPRESEDKQETFVAILQVNPSEQHPESHSLEHISNVSTDTQASEDHSQWTTRVKVMGALNIEVANVATNIIEGNIAPDITASNFASVSSPETSSSLSITNDEMKGRIEIPCRNSGQNESNDKNNNESIKEEIQGKVGNLEQKSIDAQREGTGVISTQNQNKPTLNLHNDSDKEIQEQVEENRIPGSISPEPPSSSDQSDQCDKDEKNLSLGTFDSPLQKIDSPFADASQPHRLTQQDNINNAAFGQSANSAEESQRLGTTIQGSSSEAKGMDSSNDLYHQFNPPTFSRLPPDGDEFPNSWSDEKNGPVTEEMMGSKKVVYRSEVKMLGKPPPPVPISEPPEEEIPPPLPSSVPPLPPQKAYLARRSSSVEEKKRMLIAQNANNHSTNNNNNNHNNKISSPSLTRPQEPSKKSVKDKIAMFSSRTSSTEDAPDNNVKGGSTNGYSTLPNNSSSVRTISNSTSSLPRSAATSAFSKSSDNLLGGSFMSSPKPVTVPREATSEKWKITQSTFDLTGRKNSVETVKVVRGAFNGTSTATPSTHPPIYGTSKLLPERSQSMLDVGGTQDHVQQSGSYQRLSSSYRLSSMAPKTDLQSSTSLMENRRKANLSKLRGLVIPDKTVGTPVGSASVVDLPTIISKDAVLLPPPTNKSSHKKPSEQTKPRQVTRTESLDSYSNINNNNNNHRSESQDSYNKNNTVSNDNNHSAKSTSSSAEPNLSDWKLPSALPKYSPAFKRRGLTPYQPVVTSATLKNTTTTTATSTPMAFNTLPTNYKLTTPEPKSLESLTSPNSDSSFEYSNNSPLEEVSKPRGSSGPPPTITPRRSSNASKSSSGADPEIPKDSANDVVTKSQPDTEKVRSSNNTSSVAAKFGKGKLEDSDNDSAVSSSRSSISHGLSPPNSPTPEESSSTPDPDNQQNGRELEEGEGDDSNSDEGWRVLKPQSVEAINRKNVLASAKFSSGVPRADDGVVKSKSRRSDDEEADYADAEAEDTESSCSELDVSSHRRRSSVTNRLGQIHLRRGSNSKADTEEEEEILTRVTPSHSQQSSIDLEVSLPELTQSPLQAIFDMEVQMAYINEICDALPTSGSSNNRYFSRRDSDATVIERPIIKERKNSQDQIDGVMDRRSRNRSSSGNESDFSSSVSVGSQNTSQHNITTTTTTSTSSVKSVEGSEDKWSVLEKKYSKSLTSVNLLGSAPTPTKQPVLSEAPPLTTKFSSSNEVIEKTIDKMMEKVTTVETKQKAKIIGAGIPRGRNNFKSLSEKWQQLSTTEVTGAGASPSSPPVPTTKPTAPPPPPPTKPPVFEKPHNLTSYRTTIIAKVEDQEFSRNLTSPSSSSSAPIIAVEETSLSKADVEDVMSNSSSNNSEVECRTWTAEKPRATERHANSTDGVVNSEMIVPIPMSSTKRSVSVNDIRKAFEKAEIAVSSYGRDDNCTLKNGSKDSNGLSLPSAHFRVSSFDSTTSEESSATTPAGIYGSVNSLVSSAPRDPYGSITSLASSTSLISPQELQQLIDEANQSLEEAGTPSHEVCVIILHREYAGGSLGITLAGGADYETKEITVHKVLTGSIADRDGRVHRGDRVLSINGKSTRGLTHREALNLLKAPRTEVVLVVSRGRTGGNGFQTIEETSVTLDRAVEPLLNGSLSSLLENDEDSGFKWGSIRTVMLIKDGAGLGFSLEGGKGSIHGDKPLTVKKIFVGGPAEKCGDMKVGDLIVSINGVNMASKSRTEAWNFMKKLVDGEVKISVRSPA